jgi:hypothetical protein
MKFSILLSLLIFIIISNVSSNVPSDFKSTANVSDKKATATETISTSITFNSNITINATDEEILERHLGPRKKGLSFTIIMSLIYILIFICGLFGNICICCVIITNACMHNTTNYYLFSLAVSDVLLVVFG